jgi:hypothetical protein
MKTLFAVAFLASAFTFGSCGNKPADTTNAATTTTTPATTATTTTPTPATAGTLVERLADCACTGINEVLALKKEADAAPEAKKMELLAKLDNMPEPACFKALEEEAKTTQGDEAKMQAELKVAMEKKCGATMKELGMPAN